MASDPPAGRHGERPGGGHGRRRSDGGQHVGDRVLWQDREPDGADWWTQAGISGDTETLTSVSATHGNAALGSGNAVTYTAPASGPDTISYTVSDQHGDTASGEIAVTVAAGSTAANGAVTEGHGKTVSLTFVDSGADHAGDRGEYRDVDAGQRDAWHGGARFRQRGDLHAPARRPDTISYTVSDQHGDTASGQVAVRSMPDRRRAARR